MNGFDHPQRQDQYSLKRMRWQDIKRTQHINIVSGGATPPSSGGLSFTGSNPNSTTNLQGFPVGLLDSRHDDLVSAVVPAVTVVLEGRSICQRISLHKHASYESLAKALRQMFAQEGDGGGGSGGGGEGGGEDNNDNDLDLSNAVPGHLIAYEDMENDLLLAGDLNWK
ncbi:Auxin-responsive protein IAA33 [Morus notabilis]|uniref:Auxin-responsive protein n=2 Tax=Morus notabilis TaxID=981085 RepID=W9RH29_9ROSA|nr:Auxin-responsive protein IAA33 [Morus notabilis]